MLETISLEILKKIAPEIAKKVGGGSERMYQKLKSKISNACYRYDKSYRERHGQIKVFCVGMRKPILLDDVYVEVQFLDQHTASRYKSPEEVEQEFGARRWRHFDSTWDERQDGIQVANDEQNLMLLGGPGVGKSTFLRKVGLESLKGKHGNFAHECIPVFLELKRFTEEQIDIEVLITQEFETCGYPYPEQMTKAALKSGKLLILFDGLDEVPMANFDNVIRKMGDFVDRYSQNRFIASCRIAAYTGGFTRFTEAEMADFGDSQIQTYIKNWFASTPDQHQHQLDEEMKTDDRCWKTLNEPEHQATKELARNPLLLTLLCMVYDGSQNFPRNRASLYEDALNIFLKGWAAEKRVNRGALINQHLDIADEKRMLSKIAAENLEANRLFFTEDELISQIQDFGEGNANTLERFDAPKILDTILIDQGLFVERVAGSYSFSHLTFQEYLTANYIVGHPQSIQGLVEGHLHDEQWREVFLLTAGLMREADGLLEAMEVKAAEFINTSRLKAIFQWAERITDTSNDRYNGIAKRSFALFQYFSLHLFNETYKVVENIGPHDPPLHRELHLYRDFNRDFDRYRALHLYRDLYRDLELDLGQDLDLYRTVYLDLGQDLDLELYPYFERYLELDVCLGLSQHDLRFYKDPYLYTDANFFLLVPDESRDRCDKELWGHITLVERMEEMKIFKGVDLQQMISGFNEQRKFIQAAAARKDVEYPAKSIHGTWLSVFGITDEMLHISPEELDTCLQYLRAVDLIVACKEAAGQVSTKAWQRIEDRLLVCETEESED